MILLLKSNFPNSGLTAGRLIDEIWVGFKILKILCKLNYLGFYFVYYHCNVATLLEQHFSWLLSSKAYLRCILKCKKFNSHFFHVNPTIRY